MGRYTRATEWLHVEYELLWLCVWSRDGYMFVTCCLANMRLDFISFDTPSCIKLQLKFPASAMSMDLIYGSSVWYV